MVKPLGGISEGCLDVVQFQIGQLFQHLLRAEASSKQVEHINDADSHASYTRSTATLLGIDRDPLF